MKYWCGAAARANQLDGMRGECLICLRFLEMVWLLVQLILGHDVMWVV